MRTSEENPILGFRLIIMPKGRDTLEAAWVQGPVTIGSEAPELS